MSKKTNTLWFILGATAFNILTTLISLILLLVLFSHFVFPYLSEESTAGSWLSILIFVGAIAISFFLYRIILKQISKKFDLEQHLDPIFGPRRKK